VFNPLKFEIGYLKFGHEKVFGVREMKCGAMIS
jgi:hypothetical protein